MCLKEVLGKILSFKMSKKTDPSAAAEHLNWSHLTRLYKIAILKMPQNTVSVIARENSSWGSTSVNFNIFPVTLLAKSQ